MKHLLEDVRHIFESAEDKIWNKANDAILELYWKIGYRLRDFSKKELRKVCKTLEKELEVEAALFELSYHFYVDNPIMAKALRSAQ